MKEHTKRTLIGYSKEELVEHCMCLEHNNKVLARNFDIQYRNCMKIVEDMNILNDQYKNKKVIQCKKCKIELTKEADGELCDKCLTYECETMYD